MNVVLSLSVQVDESDFVRSRLIHVFGSYGSGVAREISINGFSAERLEARVRGVVRCVRRCVIPCYAPIRTGTGRQVHCLGMLMVCCWYCVIQLCGF